MNLARLFGLVDRYHWDELAELRDRAVRDAETIARLTGELAEALARIPNDTVPRRLDREKYLFVVDQLERRDRLAHDQPWFRAHLDQHGLDLADEATAATVLAVFDLLADAWASSAGLLIQSAAVQFLACQDGGRG